MSLLGAVRQIPGVGAARSGVNSFAKFVSVSEFCTFIFQDFLTNSGIGLAQVQKLRNHPRVTIFLGVDGMGIEENCKVKLNGPNSGGQTEALMALVWQRATPI